MLSRMAVFCAAALAFVSPIAFPTGVNAQPPVLLPSPYYVRHGYFVEFRPRSHLPWQLSGPYGSPRHAHRVAQGLRLQGYHTRVIYR